MSKLLRALTHKRGPAPAQGAEVEALERVRQEQKRQIRALEKVAGHLLQQRGALPLPPTSLRVRVGRVEHAGNFWAQGLDSSQRVLEVFGADPGGPVLDWGCGSGRTLSWLRGVGTWDRWWRGSDVDRHAIKWLRQQGIASVVVCGDEPPLPYPDESFNGLFCFSVLTHIPPQLHAAWYADIRRVLRPGGRAYITVHGDWNMSNGKGFTEADRQAYAASGCHWSEREGHYKHAATVSRAFTERALGPGWEVESYREAGYHSMDDLIVRRL